MTGEPFYLNILKYLFNNFNTKKIFNCYGGTEMGNWIYFHDCKKSHERPAITKSDTELVDTSVLKAI